MANELVFGINTASLAGFILAMTSRGNAWPRSRVFRSQIMLALMIGGTILVCFGIYLKPPLLP
jgi:hypothetical protein